MPTLYLVPIWVQKILLKKDLWYSVLGGAALATGGGGSPPSYERFSNIIDTEVDKGVKFKLIDAPSIPIKELIFVNAGVGGGLQRSKAKKYPRKYTSLQDWIIEIDRIYPLPEWADIPREDWMMTPYKRMVELNGREPFGYMPFEIGPNNYREFIRAGALGKGVVHADNAGYRAVPEVSLATLNVAHAPLTPAVATTGWGDLMVFEKFLSWQRAEDLIRHVAITSGGGCSAMFSFTDDWIKKGTILGTLSLSMKVGKAILDAREKGDDPVKAIIKAADGYLLFEGEIASYTSEGYGSFTWGNSWIKGIGDYEGKTFKHWFKNENQISWIYDETYVTCPDPFTVVDKETGEGLSNFMASSWTQGRKVTVWGMKAAEAWRTERGLQIFKPKHFGCDIKYKPIEEIVGLKS